MVEHPRHQKSSHLRGRGPSASPTPTVTHKQQIDLKAFEKQAFKHPWCCPPEDHSFKDRLQRLRSISLVGGIYQDPKSSGCKYGWRSITLDKTCTKTINLLVGQLFWVEGIEIIHSSCFSQIYRRRKLTQIWLEQCRHLFGTRLFHIVTFYDNWYRK